jgi:hypothetical protein
MKHARLASHTIVSALAGAALVGCGGGSSGGGGNPNAIPAPSGITAPPASYPSTSLGAGTILLSASGEVLSLGGFDWPDTGMNDTCMVDGWEFTLYRYLTVVESVDIWSTPNLVPSDQSQHGPLVAHVTGPWVLDLHLGGPLMGKGGGGEEAKPFAQILAQDDGTAFDPSTTYAFGFNTIPATKDVYNVNLTSTPGPDGKDDLDEYNDVMIPGGYSVLYEGVATYKGAAPGQPSCDVVTSGAVGPYDFTKLPSSLPFRMGFSTPTNYVNCQNGTDLMGPGVNGEDHPRGVQVSATESTIAQVTIHMDHPFWESFAENSPLHWDQIAAQYLGAQNPVATVEDLQFMGLPGAKTTKPLDFTAFTDAAGTPIPWRTCDPTYYTTTGTGQLHFDPLKVDVTIGGADPATGLRNYYDFIRYTQATQGHLNSQGLCYIDRQYPSPPGGS